MATASIPIISLYRNEVYAWWLVDHTTLYRQSLLYCSQHYTLSTYFGPFSCNNTFDIEQASVSLYDGLPLLIFHSPFN